MSDLEVGYRDVPGLEGHRLYVRPAHRPWAPLGMGKLEQVMDLRKGDEDVRHYVKVRGVVYVADMSTGAAWPEADAAVGALLGTEVKP